MSDYGARASEWGEIYDRAATDMANAERELAQARAMGANIERITALIQRFNDAQDRTEEARREWRRAQHAVRYYAARS